MQSKNYNNQLTCAFQLKILQSTSTLYSDNKQKHASEYTQMDSHCIRRKHIHLLSQSQLYRPSFLLLFQGSYRNPTFPGQNFFFMNKNIKTTTASSQNESVLQPLMTAHWHGECGRACTIWEILLSSSTVIEWLHETDRHLHFPDQYHSFQWS